MKKEDEATPSIKESVDPRKEDNLLPAESALHFVAEKVSTKDDEANGERTRQDAGMRRTLVVCAKVAVIIIVLALVGAYLIVWGTTRADDANTALPETSVAPSSSFVVANAPPTSSPVFANDLPAFSGDAFSDDQILETHYDNEKELKHDAEQLGRYLVGDEVLRNSLWVGKYGRSPYQRGFVLDCRDGNPYAGGHNDGGGGGERIQPSSPFGTNNQDDSMDKYDSVKSDGEYLFVEKDGNSILVLSVDDEKEIARVIVPLGIDTSSMDADDSAAAELDRVAKNKGASDWVYTDHCWSTRIKGLLLPATGRRLVVLSSGHYGEPMIKEDGEPALRRQGTRVILYSISDIGDLLLEEVRDVHGAFVDAYSTAEGVIHVVTKSVINKWGLLLDPLRDYLPDGSLGWGNRNPDIYARDVATASLTTTIPAFAAKLTRELVDLGLHTNLSRFWTSQMNDGNYRPYQYSGYACRITNIHSIGAVSPTSLGEMSTTSVPTFGYFTTVYAHDDFIVLLDEAISIPGGKHTYFFLINLEGAFSRFTSFGSAPGSIIDSYSVDFHAEGGRSFVRLATIDADKDANAIYIFEHPSNDEGNNKNVGGPIGRIGQVKMGKPREEFQSVRFLDKIAYAVTFERTDPFYVVDLSEPQNPQVLGELEVTGFSEYLHPIGNGQIIGVGREADEDGRDLGLHVSLFDASNPTLPILTDRIVVETGWSIVGSDPRAFRYISEGSGGLVIIPIEQDAYDQEVPSDFRMEFYILSVTNGGMKVEMVIDHSASGTDDDWWACLDWSLARSFYYDVLFKGDKLITMMNGKVISTDLNTKEENIIILNSCCEI